MSESDVSEKRGASAREPMSTACCFFNSMSSVPMSPPPARLWTIGCHKSYHPLLDGLHLLATNATSSPPNGPNSIDQSKKHSGHCWWRGVPRGSLRLSLLMLGRARPWKCGWRMTSSCCFWAFMAVYALTTLPNAANRSWPLPDPVVPPTFGSPWALAPSGKAHRRGKRFGLWCLSRRPSIWACTKRSSNWRLYAFSYAWTLRTLTLSTILLTRNPCVWICLRGAYAKSLDEIFMHKDAAGPYARGFFDCSNTQRAADSDEEDKEDEDAQPAFKTRCCRLLFAALSRFQLQEWFLFGRHCGQMNGQKETVGPYACLTHSLRKSLTIDWGNWGSTQTSQTEDASDGWFFEQVMLQKCQCFQCDNSPGLFWTI